MNRILLMAIVLAVPAKLVAEIDVGSDGSDGVFNPQDNIAVDLSLAASLCDCDGIDQGNDGDFIDDTCRWDCPSPVQGQGIYDVEQWAVVFKYESVDIPAGVTVTFLNHPSRAPVVWLVDEAVSVSGAVNLSGSRGHHRTETRDYAEPGPGGFRGGRGTNTGSSASGGLGPGGAANGRFGPGGSYATSGARSSCSGGALGPTHGNVAILPLIGGSAGAGGEGGGNGAGGGPGGGAILIAANNSITVGGNIVANGGNGGNGSGNGSCGIGGGSGFGGGGSGGAIRVVADVVSGSGQLRTLWGGGVNRGGAGRIRVEGNEVDLVDPGDPNFVEDLPTFVFPPPMSPKLRATMLEDINAIQHPVREEPRGVIDDPFDVDANIATMDAVTIHIQANDCPLDATMDVRIVSASGPTSVAAAAPMIGGTCESSTWTAEATFPAGFSVVQVRAFFDDFEGCAGEPIGKAIPRRLRGLKTLNGERITRVAVATTVGGGSQVIYETETGRKIPVDAR